METCKKKLGANHSSTLTSMANLAFTWKGQSCDGEAIKLMDECALARTRVPGARHHLTVSSVEVLGEWDAEQLDNDNGMS